MESDETIASIAVRLITSQTFSFDNFELSKNKLQFFIKDRHYFIIYDRITLLIYESNLSDVLISSLLNELKDQMKSKSNFDFKTRDEFIVLHNLLQDYKEVIPNKIIKRERPDFEILTQQNDLIGVEVLKLLLETDAVLDKIVSENYGLNHSTEQIQNQAVEKHGQKANSYLYHDFSALDGKKITGIGGKGLHNMSESKKIFADLIKSKYEKTVMYEDYTKYIKMIILCSGNFGIHFVESVDFIELGKLLFEFNFIEAISAIVVSEYNGKQMWCEYNLMDKTFKSNI